MTLSAIVKILILVSVGGLAGLFYVKVLKKPVLGHLWVGIIIGIIGGVLGEFFLDKIILVLTKTLDINFIATLTGAFFLVWLFSKVSVQQ